MNARVKICGITSIEDAMVAVECGADAVGLVFAESPRKVTLDRAAGIVAALPPFVCPVGVFVDSTPEEVKAAARSVGLHYVQLHGPRVARRAEEFAGLSVIMVVRVADREDVPGDDEYNGVHLLLDTKSARAAGGTGETFPWEYAAGLSAKRPIILAGGLTPKNVAGAIETVQPWGVDVSSGVEKSPGVKDAEKIREFITRVRSVSYAQSRN